MREEIQARVINSKSNNLLLELPISFGKSKIALEKIKTLYKSDCKILIVIPRNVLINNWLDELHKWGCDAMIDNITFSTYVSIPKQQTNWDICLFDECHHLSKRCIEVLKQWNIKNSIFLSATIKRELKQTFYDMYNVENISIRTSDAIKGDVLPEPKILLLPLKLDNINSNYIIVKHPKCKKTIKTNWSDRWNAWKQKQFRVETTCTQKQYYDDISSLIEWYKQKSYSPLFRNQWLHKCGERLKWLSDQKIEITKNLLSILKDKRVLTFCADINQSAKFGKCVNSKVGTDNLDKFNNHKIKHLSCVGMLDEGISLKDCQIGIFNMLNSSERLTTQRIGRILRHQKPYIIIPYFTDTREQEIINKMLEEYNEHLIIKINSINEINFN